MLILSRKLNESIVISDTIIVTVLAVDGDKVKLGISAPQEVPVLRQELWLAIKEQEQIVERMAQTNASSGFESLRAYLSGELGQPLAEQPPPAEEPEPPAPAEGDGEETK